MLDNAFKYSRSRVIVSVLQSGVLQAGVTALQAEANVPLATIELENDGQALDPAAAEQVLQRGVRLDERGEGQGLGLAVTLSIVEDYGGRLEFARRAGNSVVRLQLPEAK